MQGSIKYKTLKGIADNPGVTQRQLAKEMDVSLGKANYCIHALIEKGGSRMIFLKGAQPC